MSNYIEVDHSKFESAAEELEDYVALVNSKMNSADTEITTLSTNWKGEDNTQFQSQWTMIREEGSVTNNMIKSLKKYAEFLRYCSQEYKEAQSNAVNRADGIKKAW